MVKSSPFRYVLLLLFLKITYFISAQSAKPFQPDYEQFFSNPMVQQSVLDSLILWKEDVLLKVAHSQPDNGNLFFKGYVFMGPNKSKFSLSKVLHIELVNKEGRVLKKQYHQISDATASGVMTLPKKIREGTYYLRAYTQWMQNYGKKFYAEKAIYLGNPFYKNFENSEDLKVKFFPEGGVLLNGHENRVVIQIPNIENDDSNYIGKILDSNNNLIARVVQVGPTLGNVFFTPVKNQKYQLKLNNGMIYSLPSPTDQGVLLQANNLDADTVKIRAIASGREIDKAVKLIGEIEGINYFERDLKFNHSGILDVKISKKDLPRGVLKLKLKTKIGIELALRPIWIDGKRLFIEANSLGKIAMDGREQALKIKVTDADNKPVKTGIALSFIKASSNPNSESERFQIINEDKAITFLDDIPLDRKQRFLKDLEVLTAGNEETLAIINKKADLTQIKYPFQKGLELVGYAYDLENNLLKDTNIQVLGYSDEDIFVNDVKTNDNGILRLQDLQVQGVVKFVLRTQGDDSKDRFVKLVPLDVRKDVMEEDQDEKPTSKIKKTDAQLVYQPSTWQALDTTALIELDEVEIRQTKINTLGTSLNRNSSYGGKVVVQDRNRPKTIPELFLNIPGVLVTGFGSLNPNLSILRNIGTGPILWVIDGFPLWQSGNALGGNYSPLVEIMNIVSPIDVDKIEVLIGSEASAYGSRAAGGVILISRRFDSESAKTKRREGHLVFQGFEPDFDFETYRRGLSNKEQENSSVLYWNPNTETNEHGEAIINFIAPNHQYKTKIEAMAISKDGAMGILRTQF